MEIWSIFQEQEQFSRNTIIQQKGLGEVEGLSLFFLLPSFSYWLSHLSDVCY